MLGITLYWFRASRHVFQIINNLAAFSLLPLYFVAIYFHSTRMSMSFRQHLNTYFFFTFYICPIVFHIKSFPRFTFAHSVCRFLLSLLFVVIFFFFLFKFTSAGSFVPLFVDAEAYIILKQIVWLCGEMRRGKGTKAQIKGSRYSVSLLAFLFSLFQFLCLFFSLLLMKLTRVLIQSHSLSWT